MLEKITAIAREAGQMIVKTRDAAVHQKAGHANFVTDADLAVHTYLKKALLEAVPEARFYGEEQENEPLTDALTFVVDPIDGTLNFMHHRNFSAVSIGLLKDKTPVLGVIYNPFADEMFTAEKGKGAWLNGSPIHVSDFSLDRSVVAFGTSPYDISLSAKTMQAARDFLVRCGDLRRLGSAALDLAYVACGRSDVFFEFQMSPWDVAAGALLVTEAGGHYQSFGHDHPYFEGVSGAIACNTACKDAAWEILKPYLEK